MTTDMVGGEFEVSSLTDAEANTPAEVSGLAEGPGFDDKKDADAFRTIGEVAQALAIRTHVLRYWEEQFPMLRPVKRSGGRRYYRAEDVELVRTIDRLVHHEGYTLRGARQCLEAGQGMPAAAEEVADAAPVQAAHPVMLVRLKALRATLAGALSQA